MWKCLSIGVALLHLLSNANAQDWVTPYFADPGTGGVTYTSATGPNNHHQLIDVLEELEVPFVLAVINYEGSVAPTISRFYAGDRNVLVPTFVQASDNKWELRVGGTLDYESIEPTISFEMSIEGIDITIKPRITISLINVFDNDPRLVADGNNCIIDELKAPHTTECTYTLVDPDGMLNNRHTFTITGFNGEEDIFKFEEIEGTMKEYEKQYNLATLKMLYFHERELYSFTVNVADILGNNADARIVVEVEDLPNRPPQWTTPFVSDRFDEKLPRAYPVKAIDGDTKLDKPIFYTLRFEADEVDEEWTKSITINRESGDLTIEPLDRDALKKEIFNFYITAYKEVDIEDNSIESPATIILNDVNDNSPLITIDTNTIFIWESTFETLPFDQFSINDPDLGTHATYTVELTQDSTELYSTAFTIIPSSGYQETNFIVSVTDAVLLDYENPLWQSFEVKVRSVEVANDQHTDEKSFKVELRNWNDEEPIFEQEQYQVQVKETLAINEFIGAVHAVDKDEGDTVVYSIVGYLKDHIAISETGELTSKIDDLLDYERQTNLVVTIAAEDTLVTEKVGEVLHTTYVQFIIDVEDVNDETPELRMPRTAPSIEENSSKGTVITAGIEAIDPDLNAEIKLEILWEDSYATKNGREIEKGEYQGCFIITADTTNPNRVIGTISINPDFEDLVDYEKYEVVYLTIQATDVKQEVGVGTAVGTITVRIEDVNDNYPEFVDGTDTINRTVIEASLANTVIGTIIATDADGPGFNEVKYFIESLDDPPVDWINIGLMTGELSVANDHEIDCDQPPRMYLNYKIIASDGENENSIDIAIFIIDTNDQPPHFTEFDTTVSIYEDQKEGLIISVAATDEDRDEQYRDFQYQIDYSGNQYQQNLFGIATDTGDLVVELKLGMELDRDNGVTSHTVTIVVTDNKGLGPVNSERVTLTIILLDVNDNDPVLPAPNAFQPEVLENVYGEVENQGDIEMTGHPLRATDIDEGVNGQVSFRILSIVPYEDTAVPAPNIEGVFGIISNRETKTGILTVKKSLKGYYGTWSIEIQAYDHGDEGVSEISRDTIQTYYLKVTAHNYNAPKITYPAAGQTLRLRYQGQTVNAPLYLFTDTLLQSFEAVDDDGEIYGEVRFTISGSANEQDHEFFQFVAEGTKRAQLQITKQIEDKIYYINVDATDGGGLKDTITDLKVVFVNVDGHPVFNRPTQAVNMIENDPAVTVIVDAAEDPKNEGITDPSEMYPVYYFLEEESEFFSLDKDTRVLSLKQALDRDEPNGIPEHVIVIVATNVIDGPINPDANSKLTLTISVDDVNDNPPTFTQSRWGAGITVNDAVEKILFTVSATDPDLDDVITYGLLTDTIEASSSSLNSIKDQAFEVNRVTGQVILKFKVQDNYSGYFTFYIEARDLVDHTTRVMVRVYVIAESNRVSFIFLNDKDTVEVHKDFIASTLSSLLSYDCNVDDIQLWTNDGEAVANNIEVRAHFVQDDIAIAGDVIRQRTKDLTLQIDMREELSAEGLYLYLIPDETSADQLVDKEQLLTILIIVISVLLGTICVVLIIAFLMRTRSLNRQLKAFSTTDTDFGSISSDLNRRNAPTTNVFSVEGSNPVLHNNMMRKTIFDEESIQSDDSDMIGFDDHPDFIKNGNANGDLPKRESVNVARIQDIRQSSKNPMANGGSGMNGKGEFDDDSLTRF